MRQGQFTTLPNRQRHGLKNGKAAGPSEIEKSLGGGVILADWELSIINCCNGKGNALEERN